MSKRSGHTELDSAFISQQREKLEALRQDLIGGEQRIRAEERSETELHGGEARELEDDAQTLAQREVNQAERNVSDQRILSIERALQKIEHGSYGLSDESGEPIAKARLESMPEALFTIEEERKREANR
jgi:DnaK suppressor protein